MKNTMFKRITIIILVSLPVIWLFTPAEKLEQLQVSWNRLWNDPGTACLDFYRPTLKDPDSAKLVSTSKKSENTYDIKYKAKNSYGAYVVGDTTCKFASGQVDPVLTELHVLSKDLESELAKAKKVTCLLERDALTRAGKTLEEASKMQSVECGGQPPSDIKNRYYTK